MHRDGASAFAFGERLDRLRRRHVDRFHDRAGLVGPDWDHAEVDRASPFTDFLEHRAVAAIACALESAAEALDEPAAPVAVVFIESCTRAEVLRGGAVTRMPGKISRVSHQLRSLAWAKPVCFSHASWPAAAVIDGLPGISRRVGRSRWS